MNKYTDRVNFGTAIFFLIVKFLQFLLKLGFKPNGDGWRRVTESYLRTEHSKFALAAFKLNFWSDLDVEGSKTLDSARKHLIERLAQFLKLHPATHWKLQWNRFSTKRQKKEFIDIVHAFFDENGNLKDLKTYFDQGEDIGSLGDAQPDAKATLIKIIIENYNNTKDLGDKKRPKILQRRINVCLSRKPQLKDKGWAEVFIERVLSATFISFETLPSVDVGANRKRFQTPRFIKRKHPGFGFLNIICRFTEDFNEADLWFQFSHIPADGVPMQEILNDLKQQWGQRGFFKFPAPDYRENLRPELCSTKDSNGTAYHVSEFVDFQPLRKLRWKLNAQYSSQLKGSITIVALFIWKLAQHEVFKDIKFAVPIDLYSSQGQERTLGFVFIRPSVYFNDTKPDKGFLGFQEEFDLQLQTVRERRSLSYGLLESYTLTHPIMYSATSKFMLSAVGHFVGTLGVTIIKNADFFMGPLSDIHIGGFIAIGNFLVSTEDDRNICNVSIKGPKDKIADYLEIIKKIASSEGEI